PTDTKTPPADRRARRLRLTLLPLHSLQGHLENQRQGIAERLASHRSPMKPVDAKERTSAIQDCMGPQLKFGFPKPKLWGGKREGAGRPRTRPYPGLDGAGVPHVQRPEHKARHPVHLTLRV